MGLGLRIIGSALRRWGERFDKMLVANLIAAVLALPFFLIGVVVTVRTGQLALGAVTTAVVVGVLPTPATAGLQLMTREMAAGELLLMPGPFEGLRLYWRDASRVWLVSFIITVILAFNVLFYANAHAAVAHIAEIIAVYVLIAWLAAHVYVYPLILEQEDRRLRLIYRNAFVMAMTHPVVTLLVLVFWALVLIISSASGLIVAFGLSIAAAVQQQAALSLFESFRRDGAPSHDRESA